MSFPHLFPAKFSVAVSAVGFHPLLKIYLTPLAVNLIFFSGQPLADKTVDKTGKRAGMETDQTKRLQTCSCLKLYPFFMSKCFSVCYLPLANFQSTEMVGSDNIVQFHTVWGGEDLLTFSCHDSWKFGL